MNSYRTMLPSCHIVLASIALLWITRAQGSSLTKRQVNTRNECSLDEWRSGSECFACSVCPEGFGLRKPCGSHHDTECMPCQQGSRYSLMVNGNRMCVPCTSCENRLILQSCSTEQDAVCGRCMSGFFYDDFLYKCRPCSNCYGGVGVVVAECSGMPPEERCMPIAPPEPSTSPQELVKEESQRYGQSQQTVFFMVAGIVIFFILVLSTASLVLLVRMRRDMRRGARRAIYMPTKGSQMSMFTRGCDDSLFENDSGIQ